MYIVAKKNDTFCPLPTGRCKALDEAEKLAGSGIDRGSIGTGQYISAEEKFLAVIFIEKKVLCKK